MRRRSGWSTTRAVAIVLVSALFLVPFLFMVVGSARMPGQAPPDGFEWLPQPLVWSNYESVFSFVPLARHLVNSIVVVLVAVPVTVVIASWAGFTVATTSPRRRRILIGLSVAALMVPLSALWVGRAALYRSLGIIDSLGTLIAPAFMATTPFYVLIFALAYGRVPKTIYEAARLDGPSPFAIWRDVAFPLAKPAAFAVGMLAFVWHWGNFIDPLLYISSPDNSTAALTLRTLQTLASTTTRRSSRGSFPRGPTSG